jgi:hypothetical protein
VPPLMLAAKPCQVPSADSEVNDPSPPYPGSPAVKALDDRVDATQGTEFLELVDYISSQLGHVTGTQANNLGGLADDLRRACDELVERLYTFLNATHTPADQ